MDAWAIAYSESRAFERISKDEKAIRHIFEKGSASYFKAKRDKCIDVDPEVLHNTTS
jgi:hypothetical protein